MATHAHSGLPLRVLFVSSTTSGGSGRSQRELCAGLRDAGVETKVLADDGEGQIATRYLFEQLLDASVRLKNTALATPSHWLRSLPGRQPTLQHDTLVSVAPENAFPDLAVTFRPDVVVGSSISRPTWKAIRSACASLELPVVLYLREEEALKHLDPAQGPHDAVLANSLTLLESARKRGFHAHFIPSIVDLEASRTPTSRNNVLLVNPRAEHGVGVVEELATSYPTINFVLQESWALTKPERRNVDRILGLHPNIEFRPRVNNPAEIFRDAALLLAPHQIDNRPRTVLEALANGIPVLCSDQPGLVEATGEGGIVVNSSLGLAGWRDALERVWQDPALYGQLQADAIRFSQRAEVQRHTIVQNFISVITNTINANAEVRLR